MRALPPRPSAAPRPYGCALSYSRALPYSRVSPVMILRISTSVSFMPTRPT